MAAARRGSIALDAVECALDVMRLEVAIIGAQCVDPRALLRCHAAFDAQIPNLLLDARVGRQVPTALKGSRHERQWRDLHAVKHARQNRWPEQRGHDTMHQKKATARTIALRSRLTCSLTAG